MASDPVTRATPPPRRPTAPPRPRRPRGISHQNQLLLLTLLSGATAVVIAMIFIWTGDRDGKTRWTLTLLAIVPWLGFAIAVRSHLVRPLQTLANMHAALREGDFSMRARARGGHDALGELMAEVNALSELLRSQKLGALESGALLTKVMAEIDVAIFTFDERSRLRLINPAGERLLARRAEHLLGKSAAEIGMAETLEGPPARTLEREFSGQPGRWGMRRSIFRQEGQQHHLVVIADLSRALREEEREAWQRLVRVLGHELNNSLTPVRSIAESLETLVRREPRPADWEEDLRRGLRVITERSESLSRFMRDYARLARLPKPQLQTIDLGQLVSRIAGLETRLHVEVEPGPSLRLKADPDQLEQLLINLQRNAVDASLETGGKVVVGWSADANAIEVFVRDQGHGLSNTANLFVPFFTTKQGGSGIGLALSRQIADAHGGTLSLQNREGGPGCEAIFRLPVRE